MHLPAGPGRYDPRLLVGGLKHPSFGIQGSESQYPRLPDPLDLHNWSKKSGIHLSGSKDTTPKGV